MRSRALSALLALAFLGACGDDPTEPPPSEGSGQPEVREVYFTGPPAKEHDPGFLEPPDPTIDEALARLAAAARDDDCKGLLLRVGPMSGAWGRVADLQAALTEVREKEKPVHCHFERTDNAGYALLASSCDRISMSPAGDLNLVGVSAHVFYARSLLDKLGLEAELLQMGRYKGAADPFTRTDMPEETRESLGEVLDVLQRNLVEAVSEGRNLDADRVAEIIDGGPYGSIRAREAGLVDDVGFDDEAREHARRAGGVERVRRIDVKTREEPASLVDVLEALSGEAPETVPEGPRLALVQLVGNIVDSERDGPGARSGPFVRAMRRFADDEEVRAVVLRVDSPGGSALASDRMWHAVRRAAAKKPVIVSVGDMAASGGYYVASAGTEILAHDTSMVGSIGVVGGKIAASELADRAGVNVEILARGENAAWTSPARPFQEAERAIVERMLRSTYHRFIRRVAQGRDMEERQVLAGAEGRLMSGARARELGLVDAAGGLGTAVDRAREAGGLPRFAPIERWPRQKNLLETLAELMGGGREARVRGLVREVASLTGPFAEMAVLDPLWFGGERTAVALPFVLRVD